MVGSIGQILGSLISGAFGFGATALTNRHYAELVRETNEANRAMNTETNQTNLRISQETNALNKALSELAYERSLPVSQLRDLMSAGMSKQAAISSLVGGTYTPVAMQSATMQAGHDEAPRYDSSGYVAAAEQLGNIPQSVMQMRIQEQQIKDLEQAHDLRAKEEERKQQLHEYQLWKEQYGKNTANMLDAASNKISQALIDSGSDFADYSSFNDMIRGLGLQNDKELKSLPFIAREQLFDSVGKQYAEKREQDSANRAEIEGALKHKLTSLQIKRLQQDISDFEASQDMREKQYKLAAITSQVESIARARDLTLDKDAIDEVFEFDKDGNIVMQDGMPKLHKTKGHNPERYGKIRGFWNDVAEIIPVNVLSHVLRYILSK